MTSQERAKALCPYHRYPSERERTRAVWSMGVACECAEIAAAIDAAERDALAWAFSKREFANKSRDEVNEAIHAEYVRARSGKQAEQT